MSHPRLRWLTGKPRPPWEDPEPGPDIITFVLWVGIGLALLSWLL